MKKSYNPLAMVGGWIGALSLTLYPIIVRIHSDLNWSLLQKGSIMVGVDYLWYPIIGFLIGWVINSLWRKSYEKI